MTLADSLTPKNTKEYEPGLFIQKKGKGFRHIEPVAWDGKFRWGPQIKSIISFRFIFTVGIILMLAYSYTNDNAQLIDFYNFIHEDPVQFCNDLNSMLQSDGCTSLYESYGLCYTGNYSEFKLEDGDYKNT